MPACTVVFVLAVTLNTIHSVLAASYIRKSGSTDTLWYNFLSCSQDDTAAACDVTITLLR